MFKYHYSQPYNQKSRSIDKSEQTEVNNMNSHNPQNNEQRQDERPSTYIRKRALLHQEDRTIDIAQRRSAIPEYRITIEHGSIRIGQETGTGYEEPGREL